MIHDHNGQGELPIELPPAIRQARPAVNTDDVSWRMNAERVIEELAETGKPFTAVTVAERIGEPSRHHAWGWLFVSMRQRGVIRQLDTAQSRRPATHKSLVYRWVGADALSDEEAS